MGKSENKIYSSHEQRRLLSFNLYSSYTEAILDTNPWSVCSGGQFYIGFPGFCGKVGLATAQWTETSVTRGESHFSFMIVAKGVFYQATRYFHK